MIHQNPGHVLQFTPTEVEIEGFVYSHSRMMTRGHDVPKHNDIFEQKCIIKCVTYQLCS